MVSPNLFVLCVKKVFAKTKATLHGKINADRKCQNKEGQKNYTLSSIIKKKIKIPKENASKRTVIKLKYPNEKKLMKMYQQVRKIKIDKVINNKETKDKAFNGKADDKISKSKETIKRPFSESDMDESDSPKKRKLIAINSKVLFV